LPDGSVDGPPVPDARCERDRLITATSTVSQALTLDVLRQTFFFAEFLEAAKHLIHRFTVP
jgi:hypothetical protein